MAMTESIMMQCCNNVDPTETLRQMKHLAHHYYGKRTTAPYQAENNLICQTYKATVDSLEFSLIAFT